MKRFLTRFFILLAVFSFYSCGNGLLDFMGDSDSPGGGGNTSDPDTTDSEIPKGNTKPIVYIDTQDEFTKFCNLGYVSGSTDYPLDGYYILRGNGVTDRTFHAQSSIKADTLNTQKPFTGVLTGWYMDEDKKTTVKIDIAESLFSGKSLQAEKVSWLKFEATQPNFTKSVAGIVAEETVASTVFDEVTVTGSISLSASTGEVYAGGIVGKAGSGTTFKNCLASATVTITNSAGDCYAGGIAGELKGTVESSVVSIRTLTTGSNPQPNFKPITVSSTGTGSAVVYAGGVAGKLTGTITKAVVKATVTASGQAGAAYGGGFAGSVDGGLIKDNTSNGELDINASLGGTSTSGEAFAGGLAGWSNAALESNHLSGTVMVRSKYYNTASYSGGLVGKLESSGKIDKSSVSAQATIQAFSQTSPAAPPGKAYAGGLAGYTDTGCAITESSFTNNNSSGGVSAGFSSTDVAASEAYAGGIAGYALGTISKVYASSQTYENNTSSSAAAGVDARASTATGTAAAGGIAGKAEAEISVSYAAVTVKARAKEGNGATASAGGIAGISSADIINTYALAKVDARSADYPTIPPTDLKVYAGGIVGQFSDASAASDFTVSKSYAAGAVWAYAANTTAYAGGIAGYALGGSGKAKFDSCVALQQFVSSDSGKHNRMVGELDISTAENSDCYAYENMTPHNGGGSFGISAPGNADDENGANISVTDAKDLSKYTSTTSWDSSTWTDGSFYPILKDPFFAAQPYPPDWAQIP